MKRRTRIFAVLLCAVIAFSLCACKQNGKDTASGLTSNDVIKVVSISNPSWPINDKNCKAWQYIEEGTGATVDLQAIPDSDYYSKIPLMFAAPDTLPDVMAFDNKPSTEAYAVQGALIALSDNLDKMPNYVSFMNSLPEADRTRLETARKSSDGKIYYTPSYGREKMQGVRAWLYREDIFKKHNLKLPETMEDVYSVSKELKKLYPTSYPFSMREGFKNIELIGSEWKQYFSSDTYYDYNDGTWHYGAAEDTMLEMITFLKKMIDEKLLPANFLTITTKEWQELVMTDRGFIFPDYQTRIDFFTPTVRKSNPEFTLKAMIPPIANKEKGTNNLAKYNLDNYGVVVCNTGDRKRIENALKYVDWFYTDEAAELLSWGKEGETYEVKDGKRVYITDDKGSQPNTLYGFSLPGTMLRFDPDAVDAFESELISENRDITLKYMNENVNPTTFIAFTPEERAVLVQEGAAIRSYTKEMVSKFILGQEPLSKFDEFVKTLNDMGLEKFIGIYKSAYDRIK